MELADHDIRLVRADNPGIFSLSGTNTWIVGRDPAWIVDPGPALGPHVDAVLAAAAERGGVGGIVLTHDHGDHSGAVPEMAERTGAAVHAARGDGVDQIGDGDVVGPFSVLATPGHAPDHLVFVAGRVAFSGDAVLGEGSVFVWPDPGALTAYLGGLERLRALPLDLIAPGHGPLVTDPHAKLTEYLEHRRARERSVLVALDAGGRTVDELLDAAWSDVPAALRPAAAITLAAHLDKLADEGRLPTDVERPVVPDLQA